MSAKQYVTGAVHIFVANAPGLYPTVDTTNSVNPTNFEYYGVSERYPKVSKQPVFKPTQTDISGDFPHDMSWQGLNVFVSADMHRFDINVYRKFVVGSPNLAGLDDASVLEGFNSWQDVGTLFLNEGRCRALVMIFPYGSKDVYSDLDGGYIFYNTVPLGPNEEEPMGTTPLKLRNVWAALRAFDGSQLAAKGMTHFTYGRLSKSQMEQFFAKVT